MQKAMLFEQDIDMSTLAASRNKAGVAALVLAVLAMLLLAGCGRREIVLGGPANNLTQVAELPRPGTIGSDGESSAFRLGADDLLAVSVFGIPEASVEKIRVDRSGRVSLPLAGVVQAGGMTLDQFTTEVAARLRQAHVRDPRVSVALLEVESARLTVDGQVAKPGIYPALPDMTLMQAVASAQGVTQDAQLQEVVVFRTVAGQKYAALYDLKAIRKGAYADPKIFANDTIVVGDSAARRLFRDFIQLIPLITTPIIVALQN